MFFNALVTWSRRLKATVIGNILSLINFFVDTNCPFEYNWKLKTEKYCDKIIFKCVNSIVRPIFNEKVDKKWYLWVHKQCTNALFMVEKVSLYSWKKKKKKKKLKCVLRPDVDAKRANQTYTNMHIFGWIAYPIEKWFLMEVIRCVFKTT